ncbi:hypothetical protein TPHV1_50121 [Treponema phagedenis]|uniref:Uncharacterized protein n=1 Tax=Treponema phagedenis TaxID=162 RepID=A0A0B7H1M6_TREPH|nr:hypothetical protein TPHV1_50121 [Treponema phagedenis]
MNSLTMKEFKKNWVGSHLLILERRLLKKNNFRVQKMGGSTTRLNPVKTQ